MRSAMRNLILLLPSFNDLVNCLTRCPLDIVPLLCKTIWIGMSGAGIYPPPELWYLGANCLPNLLQAVAFGKALLV